MNPTTLAADKDLEPPAGHPALTFDPPFEPPSIKPPPARYYQQHPPEETPVAPTGTAAEASEFDFRRADPERVKVEPTIIDKMKEVLHLHKRHLSRSS